MISTETTLKMPMFDTTPLQGLEAIGDAETVSLSLQPHTLKAIFRGQSTDDGYTSVFEELTSVKFPRTANAVSMSNELSALWMGPNETLVRFHEPDDHDPASVPEFIETASARLGDKSAAVIDVSDYYCLLKLQGAASRQVLEKGSPLDILSALPDSNCCAQTRLGNAAVLISRSSQVADQFCVQTRWSYADYVWRQLGSGMQEYLSTKSV